MLGALLTLSTLLVLSAARLCASLKEVSICDKYTTALLKNNTADNQFLLLILLVNTAVIGNYTQPNVGIAVPGILAAGSFDGQPVNLLQYFNGQLASTNVNGIPTHQSFLDGGGAAPLKMNMPANETSSNQVNSLLSEM